MVIRRTRRALSAIGEKTRLERRTKPTERLADSRQNGTPISLPAIFAKARRKREPNHFKVFLEDPNIRRSYAASERGGWCA